LSLRRPVFALCLRLTGNRADAEDVCQDVWLAIHAGLPRFRGDAQPSTWVYRIAVRIALRAQTRRRPHDELTALAVPSQASAHDQLEIAERDRLVAEALTRLPVEQCTVLSLFAIEELSHKEIAAILGVPEGTVWSRLHTARKRLAKEIAPTHRAIEPVMRTMNT